jgi:hypothetical protein
MKHSVTKFAHWFPKALTELHPLWYICSYALIIPIFAAIYSTIPDGFHAPYARLEKEGKEDALQAALIVQAALHRRIGSTSGKPHQSFVPLYLIDTPQLKVVRTDDSGNLLFRVDITLRDRDTPINASVTQFSIGAGMTPTGRWNNHRDDNQKRSFRYIQFDKDELIEKTRMFRDIPSFGERLDSELSELAVTEDEEQAMQRFFSGVTGDPMKVSGSWPRMFYFSAMVITTVGFGDIVPINPVSRWFVMIESVGGVALFGLFINAIAWRSSNKP